MLVFLFSMVLAVTAVLLALVGAGYAQSPKAFESVRQHSRDTGMVQNGLKIRSLRFHRKIADKMHNYFHGIHKTKIGLYRIKSPCAAPRNPEHFMRDLGEARAHLKAASRADEKKQFNDKLGPEEIWATLDETDKKADVY